MMWALFAILSGVGGAARAFFGKLGSKEHDVFNVTLAAFLYSIPVLAVPVLMFGVPQLKAGFWTSQCALAVLWTVALLSYFKAFKDGGLGKMMPLLSLTPIFVVGSAYFINGELPNLWGLVGIVSVVVGHIRT